MLAILKQVRRRYPRVIAALVAAFTTVLVVLLVLNATLGNKHIDRPVRPLYAVEHEQFARTMGAMLGPTFAPGNRVVALENGKHIFPAMLDAIRQARRSITLESYVWSGQVGREFADALAERAAANVPVLVLLDAIGSETDEDVIESMERAGVQVRRYNPVRLPTLGRLNNRTHRKLMVVDGLIGFTGGAGLADKWSGSGEAPDEWRDTHY